MKFESFLKGFIPLAAQKNKQLNQASWILETTGSSDSADLKGELDAEFRLLFNEPETYQKLLEWEKESHDPIHERQLNVLIRAFKQNQIPKILCQEIARKEALLAQSYASFRPRINGKELSENDIRTLLKIEKSPVKRREAWEASKQIGKFLAPQILSLVRLRNQGAKTLGYSDYFEMQLDLQEVDSDWLFTILEELSETSKKGYRGVLSQIEERQRQQFGTHELGPWAWGDPFCQEDPLDVHELDSLLEGVDILATCTRFYQKMGIDVGPILARSDLYERPGKNQHAFCTHIDRIGDVRTLCNIKPSIKWLETVLHELGHAIYEIGFDPALPWLLREPPHMIPTEAMALLAGRQAYRSESLFHLIGPQKEPLRKKADESLRRRQLIFSRWVLVMSAFERELYRNPDQDLNRFWWRCVEKYQNISPPPGREDECDWAAKYHIGLAPVYYFSYLLGELFASAIEERFVQGLATPKAGEFLQKKLFFPGNRMSWGELVKHVTGSSLNSKAWVKEFAS